MGEVNKWVFNLDLNKLSEEDCLMQGGRLVHRFGAAYDRVLSQRRPDTPLAMVPRPRAGATMVSM